MFNKFKIKPAKKHDLKKVRKLFFDVDQKIKDRSVKKLINKKKVLVLKKRNKIKAAFAYTIFGVCGLFSFMYIKKIAVDKNDRGVGIGSHLLYNIKNFSRRKGVKFSLLYSLKKAVNFYKKNKLKKCGRLFWWKN